MGAPAELSALHQGGSLVIPLAHGVSAADAPGWLRAVGVVTAGALVAAITLFAHLVIASASPAGAASRGWLAAATARRPLKLAECQIDAERYRRRESR